MPFYIDTYIHRMTLQMSDMKGNTKISMAESELKKLETRIDEMLRACARLSEENASLRKQQRALMADRAKLLEKTTLSQTRVETMIQRLKLLEQRA
jgi:cell division protein ZapB